jgi:hypothetical protein
MIAYKVVGKRHRYGSNLSAWLQFNPTSKSYKAVIEKVPFLFPRYQKGKTIVAAEGTIGIMCFETKKAAENFIDSMFNWGFCDRNKVKIIKVESKEEPLSRNPRILCSCVDIFRLAKYYTYTIMYETSYGTHVIAFKSITVLE